MMRDAGAAEVHMRIASPPTSHSCFYGVDTPERAKLLAAQMTVGQMANFINADSLSFLTIDGLYRALGESKRQERCPPYCDARSEEHTSALQSLMRISYAVFCLT